MKKTLTILVALFCSLSAIAQSGGVKGKVVNRADRSQGIPGAKITLDKQSAESWVAANATTASDGSFLISGLEDGVYTMVIEAQDYIKSTVYVTVDKGFVKDLMFVSLTLSEEVQEVDASSFAEFDMDDSGYSDSPTILFTSNDIYATVTSYDYSAVRMRNRGYSSESQDVFLAGIRLNDAVTGYSPFSLWSGLNEAMRAKETVNNLYSSDFGFAGYNGAQNIDATASSVRTGSRFSALTNSALYRLRLMGTYATGEMDNGWSFATNVSARIGGNDWVQGVFYRSFAWYAGAEKNWGDVHRLAFSAFSTPGRRGAQNSATQEVYDLVGDNMYNSNWGYQNGKVRNARERITNEPIAFVKYDYTPSDRFHASATLLYRGGSNGYTALDWYDAQDPRPDYYRNLPSYFCNPDPQFDRLDPVKAMTARNAWVYDSDGTTRQLNWDRLYNVNYHSYDPAYSSTELRSKYVVEERRVDQRDLNFAGSFNWKMTDFFKLKGGVSARVDNAEHYKVVNDLLGGDYYVNIDQFAERDYASDEKAIQNDLDYYLANGKAQMLRQGDKYGYDYIAKIRNASGWMSAEYAARGVDAFVSAKLGYEGLQREGLVRKGLFADGNASFGNSEQLNFITYAVKAGAGYYFGGAHKLDVNAGFFNDAPTFSQAFVSPRTRNTVIPHLSTTKTLSTEANYWFSKGGYELHMAAFYTSIWDQTSVKSFYDDSQNSFTNFAISGISERHAGVELGFKVPTPVSGLNVQGAFTFGEYIYTSTPMMTQTIDNSARVVFSDVAIPYWAGHSSIVRNAAGEALDVDGNVYDPMAGKDYKTEYVKHHIPSTPQLAAVLGLKYRTNNYWFFEASADFFGRSYLDMNPLYRTDVAVNGPDGKYSLIEEDYMAAQEQFKPVLLGNLSIGKSWQKSPYNWGFSLQVRNLSNNRWVHTGGYEQTRLIDSANGERYFRFDPKYFYMSGFNYMLNLYFRF